MSWGAMSGIWLFRGTTVLAAAALLLALSSLGLVLTNRSLVAETDEQRAFLQQTARLNGVSETLVRLIAQAAVEHKDQQLRDILGHHGFRIQDNASPAPANTPPSEPK